MKNSKKLNPFKLIIVASFALLAGYYFHASYTDQYTPNGSTASDATIMTVQQRGGSSGRGGWGQGGGRNGAMLQNARYAAVAKGKIDIDGGIIDVAARRGGTFREVYVKEGDDVVKGQILALQEDDEERIALKRSEAQLMSVRAEIESINLSLKIAIRELERLKPLLAMDAISTLEFDRAQDDVDILKIALQKQEAALAQSLASVDSAKFLLEQRTVRAPMDGRIIEVQARPGVGASSLNVSTAFVLMPVATKIVSADVDEAFVADVQVGQKVIISPDARPNETYKGEVIRIGEVFGRRITQDSTRGGTMSDYAIEVVISIEDNALKLGQRVLARFQPVKKQGDNPGRGKSRREMMRERLEKMTPEERQKFREEMQKRRQQNSSGQ